MARVIYYDEQVETMEKDKLREFQFAKLQALLKRVYASNAFYKKKFKEAGIEFSDIKSFDDLKKLPFTVKKEFEEDQKNYPLFGTNLTQPMEEYLQYHQTSGTTGKPIKFLDTKESWAWRGRVAGYILRGAGVTKGDRVLFPFNFGPYTAFWAMYEGVYQLGNMAIPTGGWTSVQRLNCIIENQATVIPMTPTYAVRLADVAQEEKIDIANSSVRILMLTGEPGGLVPTIREKVERLWGARCFDYMGMTEVGTWGFQCTEEPDGVHPIESEFIPEVVNPETGMPVEDGERGELIITNLGRACMPAIRYRTGDLVKEKKGICACGRTFRVFEGGIVGRKDEMVVIRAVNVFPSYLISAVEKHTRPGDNYLIEAYKNKEGIDQIRVTLEPKEQGYQAVVSQSIQDEIKGMLNLRVEMQIVEPGTIPISGFKTKRFVDRRKETAA
jgi:phenylacetate-CoA ligase